MKLKELDHPIFLDQPNLTQLGDAAFILEYLDLCPEDPAMSNIIVSLHTTDYNLADGRQLRWRDIEKAIIYLMVPNEV